MLKRNLQSSVDDVRRRLSDCVIERICIPGGRVRLEGIRGDIQELSAYADHLEGRTWNLSSSFYGAQDEHSRQKAHDVLATVVDLVDGLTAASVGLHQAVEIQDTKLGYPAGSPFVGYISSTFAWARTLKQLLKEIDRERIGVDPVYTLSVTNIVARVMTCGKILQSQSDAAAAIRKADEQTVQGLRAWLKPTYPESCGIDAKEMNLGVQS